MRFGGLTALDHVDFAVERSEASAASLWWPPDKLAGRRLGPYLAAHSAGLPAPRRVIARRVALTPSRTSGGFTATPLTDRPGGD